jgi:HK97 family phage major capsid protein/HK97 family phage prohead protease
MLTRAYSILNIKSVDTARRVFSGVATTATPDRMDDIIEPLGVIYKNPLPLHLYHDSQKPVGHVTFKKPTADGIEFEASISVIDEPGALQDRVNEAWQSVQAKLLRGVSIGFRAIEMAFLKTGGIHFLKTEVLELSLVSIPANAEALISTIKSLDVHQPAATGQGAAVTSTSGATDTAGKQTMKTISENIADFQKSRTPKAERMSVIMQKAVDEGRTLNETEKTEYDGLATQVKDVDEHIVRLGALEDSQRKQAKPIDGTTTEKAADSRATTITVEPSKLPPGIEFARYVMCLANARGNAVGALEIAKARYPDNRRIQTLLKAAVAGATTTDPTWAGPLVVAQTIVSEFIEFLRPLTILGKFGVGSIPSLRRVPFNVRITGQTSGGTGYWVGQGHAKPLTRFDFNAITLYWAKVAAISVISEDLIRFSSPSAETLVRDGLAGALTARLDIDFIDPSKAAVPNVSPGSIVNGLGALTPSGTDATAVRADVKQLFEAFINANVSPTTGVFIMPQTLALALSLMVNALGQPEFPGITMNGGTFFGLPVITSQYATFGSPIGNMIVLVNASDIFLSDDGAISIDASREASLEMESAPTGSISTGSPLGPVATELVSMYQTNSVALRAERFINWARRRDESVAWMDDVLWGAGI